MTGRRLITALAIVFFALPIGLRAVGMTARPFENRPMATRPELDAGWGVFDQTTRFFVDRMPLREQAVRAHSWAALHVLDVSPTWRRDLVANGVRTAGLPQDRPGEPGAPAEKGGAKRLTEPAGTGVIVADGGWLFLGEDLASACAATLPPASAAPRAELVLDAVRKGGREAVFAIVPDKSTIYPERVPRDATNRECAEAARARLWPAFEQAKDPGIIALRDDLLEAQSRSRELLYRRKDTHWNAVGAAVMVERVLEGFDGPRMAPGELVELPPLESHGDLTTLLGAPEPDPTPDRAIRRASDRVLPGRTLFIRDSFGGYALPLLEPYAEQIETYEWSRGQPAELAAAVRRADRVIIEVVEREIDLVLAPGGPFMQLVAELRR